MKENIEELYNNLPPETGNLYIFFVCILQQEKKNYFIAYFSSFFSSEIKNIPDDERLMCNNLYNFFKPFAYCFELWKCQGSGGKKLFWWNLWLDVLSRLFLTYFRDLLFMENVSCYVREAWCELKGGKSMIEELLIFN
jgi:hypothetical protein